MFLTDQRFDPVHQVSFFSPQRNGNGSLSWLNQGEPRFKSLTREEWNSSVMPYERSEGSIKGPSSAHFQKGWLRVVELEVPGANKTTPQ